MTNYFQTDRQESAWRSGRFARRPTPGAVPPGRHTPCCVPSARWQSRRRGRAEDQRTHARWQTACGPGGSAGRSSSRGRPGCLGATPRHSTPADGRWGESPLKTSFLIKQLSISLVYWGLTPQQQPGSYQGGKMMMKSVFWWRKPEYPEETTDLRQSFQKAVDDI